MDLKSSLYPSVHVELSTTHPALKLGPLSSLGILEMGQMDCSTHLALLIFPSSVNCVQLGLNLAES